MYRRVLAAAGAAALLAVALPALPAVAAGETGTAKLVVGTNVYPSPTAPQTLKVNVANTSAAGVVNAIRLTFPPSAVGITPAALQPVQAEGWTVTPFANGSSLFFSGGKLESGKSIDFSFDSLVARPAADRAGKFAVTMSTDGGATGFAASEATENSLRSTVRVLELLQAPAPTAPAGVTDRSATGRQAITYGFDVKNHGSAALSTAASLVPAGLNLGGDRVGTATEQTIAPGATATYGFPVTLGHADDGDRRSSFIGSASAAGAAAPAKTDTIDVQKPALLTLGSVQPNVVKPGISQAFEAVVTKTGAPALTLRSGSLSFARTTAPLAATGTVITANAPTKLSFASVQVVGDGSKTTPPSDKPTPGDGDNKSYAVTLDVGVIDGNGYAYDAANTLRNGMTLDSIGPVVTVAVGLPSDGDRAQQTAVKNGDKVDVTGTLDRCADTLKSVELRPSVGAVTTVPVTKGAAGPDGSCSFSGSVVPASYDPAADKFSVVASAADTAANDGSATSADIPIDNVAPAIGLAQTVSSTQISVDFNENKTVLGGCNPSQYKVDGEPLVAQVLYSDGSPCVAGQAGPRGKENNRRLLVLTTPKAEEFTSNLTYTPGTRPGADPAKDGAGADAAKAIVSVVQGVVPAPPKLVKATRNGGTETAFAETSGSITTYHTRIVGDDLLLEFSGGRAGYTARLSDAQGNALRTVSAGDALATVRVPLGTLPDGLYGFRLQLLNQSAIPSNPVSFNVSVDRVAPTLAGATPGLPAGMAPSVVVNFSESIVGGTDFAFDWTVTQQHPQDGTTYIAVTKVSPTSRTSRTLETQTPVAAELPTKALYEMLSPGAKRYQDRAGNQLANGQSQ